MVGDVWDYNSLYVRIISGEKRKIIFFKDSDEYQKCLAKGMKINAQVEFNNDKIISFF